MRAAGLHAVVVGSASGIGAGLCRVLAAEGASLDLCDIDLPRAEALAAELRSQGADATAEFADVTVPGSLDRAHEAIRRRRMRIDLAFLNAGGICLKLFLDATEQDWEWLVRLNLIGMVNSVRAFLPGLQAQGAPSRMVVTGSVSSLRSPDMAGQTLYVASKAAVLGLCQALQTELQGGPVALSVVLPGPVESELRSNSERARPGSVGMTVPKGALGATGPLPALEAGRRILDGVLEGRRYITTHPGEAEGVRQAQAEILAAFARDPAKPVHQ